MDDRARQLRRIEELCAQLSTAVDASFRVREQAEALKRAAQALAESTEPERRYRPRVATPAAFPLAITFAES